MCGATETLGEEEDASDMGGGKILRVVPKYSSDRMASVRDGGPLSSGSSMSEATTYPASGEILDGKYRVEKLLGEGGMGAVARATHLLLHRTVAVKFMNPQFMTFPGAVERFLNEGRASGAIRSDHVVPVSDVGCLPSGTPYLVMECLYGLDLADLVARDGPSGLPVNRAVHFVLQILRGLQAAHAIGIIHRDMKPSNCFVVNEDGDEDFVKILDFGISKIAQPGSASLTQTNSALGTPLYMSPEQARSPRDVDARSDLYSVGVILYELLSGHTPFFSESGEFTEILFQLFTADPPPIRKSRPDLPVELAEVVHKALAREVPDRYASALEMAESLLPFADPRSHVLVERMRVYRPARNESIVPHENLPSSLAAFSQLQRGAGTDLMANRPTTDVSRGAPFTEMIAGAPGPVAALAKTPQRTELLRSPPRSPPPAPVSVDALGRTQLGDSIPVTRSSRPSAAQTDLGATTDAVPQPAEQGRSPFVYALPLLALVGIGAGAFALLRKDKPADTVVVTTASAPPPVVSVPSASAPVATAAVATSASSAVPPLPPPVPPPHVPAHPNNQPGNVVNKGIKE